MARSQRIDHLSARGARSRGTAFLVRFRGGDVLGRTHLNRPHRGPKPESPRLACGKELEHQAGTKSVAPAHARRIDAQGQFGRIAFLFKYTSFRLSHGSSRRSSFVAVAPFLLQPP